jgi:hypothetical protein
MKRKEEEADVFHPLGRAQVDITRNSLAPRSDPLLAGLCAWASSARKVRTSPRHVKNKGFHRKIQLLQYQKTLPIGLLPQETVSAAAVPNMRPTVAFCPRPWHTLPAQWRHLDLWSGWMSHVLGTRGLQGLTIHACWILQWCGEAVGIFVSRADSPAPSPPWLSLEEKGSHWRKGRATQDTLKCAGERLSLGQNPEEGPTQAICFLRLQGLNGPQVRSYIGAELLGSVWTSLLCVTWFGGTLYVCEMTQGMFLAEWTIIIYEFLTSQIEKSHYSLNIEWRERMSVKTSRGPIWFWVGGIILKRGVMGSENLSVKYGRQG